MTDPVEELVAALTEAITPSALTTEPIHRDQFISVQMTGAGYDKLLASISRFNAERGDGVWVSYDDLRNTVLHAAVDNGAGSYAATDIAECVRDRIAAINPEENDE